MNDDRPLPSTFLVPCSISNRLVLKNSRLVYHFLIVSIFAAQIKGT
jgi:hypothetical protein